MLALLPSTAMPLHSPTGHRSAFRAPLARERDANAARGRKQANENAIQLHPARTAVSLPMSYIAPRVSGPGQNLLPLFVYGTEQPRQAGNYGEAAGSL